MQLESLFHQDKASSSPPPPPRTPPPPGSASSPALLPAANITPEKQDGEPAPLGLDASLQEGLNIERPPSALHSGNFTPEELSPDAARAERPLRQSGEGHVRSASAAWMATSPPTDYSPFVFGHGSADYRQEAFRSPGPSSLGSSLSSSFVLKPPTSPLVQSESNDDEMDLTLPLNSFNFDASSPRSSRRHTLNLVQSPSASAASRRQSPLRRDGTYPYQAHQPRRSLNSTPSYVFAGSSPHTPAFFRPRRPSFTSEASPLQHASMVGSYEESILRGRMSTTPSKPLEFMAQIGVLGLGKCKPNLRCPPHVTLPFSAVFYSYSSTPHGRSEPEDGPSPYVGQIDLENGLPNPDDGQRAKRKLISRYQDRKGLPEEDPFTHDSPADLSDGDGPSRRAKYKRRSRSPKAPPGGSYRIPEKGQLQIIIKNQNKTAVKLFLVPYDLAGMEPGTKTFIRQRSYSAGPIIEPAIHATATTTTTTTTVGAADRPILRYLIHLHICCPSKGRYYLYKTIRVVFANRVPDGKERLRNEVTYPDPRFTPYKPASSHHHHHHHHQHARRRSDATGFFFPRPHPHQHQQHKATEPDPPNPRLQEKEKEEVEQQQKQKSQIQQDASPRHTTPPPTHDDTEMTTPPSSSNGYEKLNKGDAGYGGSGNGNGNGNGSGTPGAEGLLSKRLRQLGVWHPVPAPPAPPGEEGGEQGALAGRQAGRQVGR